VVALATWLVAASPPPSSAAAVVQVASSPPKTAAASAAPGGDADQRVQRVPDAVEPGNLVDEELDEQQHAAGAEKPRALQDSRPPGRSTQPSQPAAPVRNTTA
jgi:hypothetical protein